MAHAKEKVPNEGRDIWNDAEIRIVVSLLHRLASDESLVQELAKTGEPQIGVICMYSEQQRRIVWEWSQQPLSETFKQLVTIDTVDAYQGQQNAIVILSLEGQTFDPSGLDQEFTDRAELKSVFADFLNDGLTE